MSNFAGKLSIHTCTQPIAWGFPNIQPPTTRIAVPCPCRACVVYENYIGKLTRSKRDCSFDPFDFHNYLILSYLAALSWKSVAASRSAKVRLGSKTKRQEQLKNILPVGCFAYPTHCHIAWVCMQAIHWLHCPHKYPVTPRCPHEHPVTQITE